MKYYFIFIKKTIYVGFNKILNTNNLKKIIFLKEYYFLNIINI